MNFFPVFAQLDIESRIQLGLCSHGFLKHCNRRNFVYNKPPKDGTHVRKIRNWGLSDYSDAKFDHLSHFYTDYGDQPVTFPRNLKYLQSEICDGILPQSLVGLLCTNCGPTSFQGLDNHPNLTKLHLRGDFNFNVKLPPNLIELTLGGGVAIIGELPKELKLLTLSESCKTVLTKLPEFLVSLDLGSEWNHPLPVLPETLENLILSDKFTHPINSLPRNLRFLSLGESYNFPMPQLPCSLETLILPGYDFITCITYLPPHLSFLQVCTNVTFQLGPCLSLTKLVVANDREEKISDFTELFPNLDHIDMYDCPSLTFPCFPKAKTLYAAMANLPGIWDGWTNLKVLKVRECESGVLLLPQTAQRIHLKCGYVEDDKVVVKFDLPDSTTFLQLSGCPKCVFKVRISPNSCLRHFKMKEGSTVKVSPNFPEMLQFINGEPIVHKDGVLQFPKSVTIRTSVKIATQ